MSPELIPNDREIAWRCKLPSRAELGRGAIGQEDLFVGPLMERRGDFGSANLQAES
jgi:hypothetical protein